MVPPSEEVGCGSRGRSHLGQAVDGRGALNHKSLSQPISRILFLIEAVIIYLRRRSPGISSSLPAGCSRRRGNGSFPGPRALPAAWPCSRRGLPGRNGYPLRRWSLTPPFHPYPGPEGPAAVCFCGPVCESPRPGVTRRCTLWSPDFPRPVLPRNAITCPTQAHSHVTTA